MTDRDIEREAFDTANIRDAFGQEPTYRERELMFIAWQASAAHTQERCAVIAWTHYMNTCRKISINPSTPTFQQFCCADAVRKGIK